MILQLALITLYAVIFCVTVPSFWRLIRNRPVTFDSIRACVALLAASIVNGFFIQKEVGFVLFDSDSDVWRIVSAVITSVIFLTLCVVVLRTERAMHREKS